MQTVIYVGGKKWIVDEGLLLNFLYSNAVMDQQKEIVKEINNEKSPFVILNEKTN